MDKKYEDKITKINNLEKISNEYIEKKDYINAIKVYTKIINYKNDESMLYVKRADLYCKLAQSYKNISGEIWRNEERYNNAIKDCTKAIMLDPKQKKYYIMRADIYTNIFEEDRLALKDYLKAYEIDKNDDKLCAIIGDMYWLIDDSENALKYYKLAINMNFKNESALYSIASIYDLNDRIEEALKYYTEFIKYNHDNSEVYCDRANCFYNLKMYNSALNDLENFVKYNGSNTERSCSLRGKIYGALDIREESLIEYEKAIKIEKDTNTETKLEEKEKNIVNNCSMKVINNTIQIDMIMKKITEFEEIIGTTLPSDYKNFILKIGDKKLEHCDFKTQDGFIESSILNMLPVIDEDSKNLYEQYELLNKGSKIPKTLIAIAIDPTETPICLCVNGKNKGKVYYWLREFEEDNFKPSYKNMHIIADTFQEFINKLY